MLHDHVVALLVAETTEEAQPHVMPFLRAQRERDRRTARAGVVPECVCEECFRGFQLPE